MNQTRQKQREQQRERQRQDERHSQQSRQEHETPTWGQVIRDPRESIDWRRHRHGCPYYRERWFPHSEPEAGEPMYQVFCLMNTPPESWAEQDKCLASRTRCWRHSQSKADASQADTPDELDKSDEPDIPLESIRGRAPNPAG